MPGRLNAGDDVPGSGFYSEDLAAIHASGFTDLARAAAEELISRLSGPCRIVEFGCGDGTTGRELCDAGHQVHGFDVSEAMIGLAKQREPRATFEVGSFHDTAIPACAAIIAIGESSATSLLGYAIPGEKVDGDVWLVSDDPGVAWGAVPR